LENSICAAGNCRYVPVMSWQQILALGIVMAVAVIFVWRSSDPEKHKHGCGCGCHHDHDEKTGGEKTASGSSKSP
jgi:hypothetical protein